MSDAGIHPIVGYGVGMLLFALGSFILFFKTEYAIHIFTFLGVLSASSLGGTKRNEFLKSILSVSDFFRVRILENILILLPFAMVLIWKMAYIHLGLLIFIGSLISQFKVKSPINRSIPTPFSKFPFEFTVGFRNSILAILFSYFLTFMAIRVGNFNLGLFALILVFAICISYYTYLEGEWNIWIHKLSSPQFLRHKVGIALGYSSLLSLPVLISMAICFNSQIHITLIILLFGYLYLIALVIGKYAAYPNLITLPQTVLIGVTLMFPPLIIGVIIYFYRKSSQRLNLILE